MEYDGNDQLLRRYVYGAGIDEPVALVTPSNSHYYYHFDGQGSVIALTDGTGIVAERYRYSPFGESSDVSPLGNPYRYTGRRLDDETRLYYYRARYYSASLGRFLQPDPIGYGDGLNLYAYVGNDPLNFVDPLGLYSIGTLSDRISNAFALVPETAYDVYDQAGGNIGIALSGGAPALGFSVKAAIRSAPALVKNLGATVKGLFTKGATKSLAGLSRGQAKTALKTAQEGYKGTTRVGHALSKHAGRNSDVWGKITGSQKTWNDQAMKHMRDIFRGSGEFKRVTNDRGITFLEKRLSDGRGIRLNQDHTFKGFID